MDVLALAATRIARHLAADTTAVVVKSWRDDHPPTPHARYDLPIIDHWTPRLQRALGRLWTRRQVRLAIDTARRVAPLSPSHDRDTHRALILSVARGHLAAVRPDTGPLQAALRGVIADAWTAGQHVARIQARAVGKAAAQPTLDVHDDWSTWEPGHIEAALRTAHGALQQALDAAGVTIQGLTATSVRQVGDVIADGLLDGDSTDTIADDITGLLGGNPVRAELVAVTETARAMTSASVDQYAADGFTQWDWMTTSGACPICVGQEALNPHTVGDDQPPAHPRCRCATSPVVESHTDWITPT